MRRSVQEMNHVNDFTCSRGNALWCCLRKRPTELRVAPLREELCLEAMNYTPRNHSPKEQIWQIPQERREV